MVNKILAIMFLVEKFYSVFFWFLKKLENSVAFSHFDMSTIRDNYANILKMSIINEQSVD